MKKKIAVAKGDGIGPEIMDAVLRIFEANDVQLEYDFVEMGKAYFEAGHSTGMTDTARNTIEGTGILFKGPMETPKGKGVKSINVTARKVWNTYANQRDFRTLNGVNTVFSNAGIRVNLTVVRENIEDTYGGIEHMLTNDVAVARRIITRPGSAQVITFAFEMARRKGAKKVACGHKANIMKLTDGLFLETFYEIAKNYPEIEASDIIVDDLCMKLASRPEMFEVLVLTNLQGDIVSDLCAGLVGGLGFAPSANVGDNISIFEAVHGTAPDIAGKNIANPTALLLSGVSMLRYLGLTENAAAIENALLYTLEQGIHTGDFGDKNSQAENTSGFAEAIITNLGKVPQQGGVEAKSNMDIAAESVSRPEKNIFTETAPDIVEEIMGVDVFIRSNMQPADLAAVAQAQLTGKFKLVMISNRGTQIWPTGSVFTELVNQFRLRLEKTEGEISQQDVFIQAAELSEKLEICSLEMLKKFGDRLGYSLAQGQ